MSPSNVRLVLLLSVAGLTGCGGNVNIDDTTPECDELLCDLGCPDGYVLDEAGCPTCECVSPSCEGPNPAGCVVNACPPDQVCDTSVGCTSSSCACVDGFWACDDDCGGGTCVPVSAGCEGPNPAGCVSTGCAEGEICDSNLGCLPSGCSCDESSGSWGCTADCGGGVCVPDPGGCMAPYPGGCFETGCPIDQVCLETSGVCVTSLCVCDNGNWACTDDCGGGVCGP